VDAECGGHVIDGEIVSRVRDTVFNDTTRFDPELRTQPTEYAITGRVLVRAVECRPKHRRTVPVSMNDEVARAGTHGLEDLGRIVKGHVTVCEHRPRGHRLAKSANAARGRRAGAVAWREDHSGRIAAIGARQQLVVRVAKGDGRSAPEGVDDPQSGVTLGDERNHQAARLARDRDLRV
jgi:hypothetical protein